MRQAPPYWPRGGCWQSRLPHDKTPGDNHDPQYPATRRVGRAAREQPGRGRRPRRVPRPSRHRRRGLRPRRHDRHRRAPADGRAGQALQPDLRGREQARRRRTGRHRTGGPPEERRLYAADQRHRPRHRPGGQRQGPLRPGQGLRTHRHSRARPEPVGGQRGAARQDHSGVPELGQGAARRALRFGGLRRLHPSGRRVAEEDHRRADGAFRTRARRPPQRGRVGN